MNMNNSQLTQKSKSYWPGNFGLDLGYKLSLHQNQPNLIITPDLLSAEKLKTELLFFLGKDIQNDSILVFPGWETLPYDSFSPHEDIISERILALYRLANHQVKIVIADVATMLCRLPPKSYILNNSLVLSLDDDLDLTSFRRDLEERGYSCVTSVVEHGEFSIRGSIMDIFPTGSDQAYRIDLFDTQVESIKILDVDTQLSIKDVSRIEVLPAKEYPLNQDGITRFIANWKQTFGENSQEAAIYQSIAVGHSHPGIEYYLPLFFAKTTTLFDYLPANTQIFSCDLMHNIVADFWGEVDFRYEQLRHDLSRPILNPHDIFINFDDLSARIGNFNINPFDQTVLKQLFFKTDKLLNNLGELSSARRRLQFLYDLTCNKQLKLLMIAQSKGYQAALIKQLNDLKIYPAIVNTWQEFMANSYQVAITIADVEQALDLEILDSQLEFLVVTEAQIFGDKLLPAFDKKESKKTLASMVSSLAELQIGDPVVHIDYGIGRYLGLQKIQTEEIAEEFLVLAYDNSSKLYVPITSLELINRYSGIDSEHIPLDKLGSKNWEANKKKAEQNVRDVAAELLEIHARRQKATGTSFSVPKDEYERFIESFPYITTIDQQRAIDDVVADMRSPRLMDRLICGDVGFGKTEVAMRAAFLAACNQKQVVILTPTTLLAKQHFDNFRDRFASLPITIAIFSRFNTAQEHKQTLEGLATGKIDIVIGTHKLLQKNVNFKQLGLLVIDEEHRFGVVQKEHIKRLASNIDILSMTATPIPRTLSMAFAEIRDLSIIATPPAKRLSIKTFIAQDNDNLVKEAILREILRGGQVYYLHNNIATIGRVARRLQALVPNVKLAIAHGKMAKHDLDKIMNDFYHLRGNLLLCTTIIESGIDIPTANTIIIDRADNFGLAQLYQLRGRVGRSHHQAYAYLLVPGAEILSKDAKKRLEAVEMMKDLGTGFALAINDLEIRGAGEILGAKQSGVIQGIGFSLYMEMLERAVRLLKKSKSGGLETKHHKVELELQLSALIPDKYINDVNLRLVLYKKIAEAKTIEDLEKIEIEIVDQYGALPNETKNLFRITSFKLLAEGVGITKITLRKNSGVLAFGLECKLDTKLFIDYMQHYCKTFKFKQASLVEFEGDFSSGELRLAFVEGLLQIVIS